MGECRPVAVSDIPLGLAKDIEEVRTAEGGNPQEVEGNIQDEGAEREPDEQSLSGMAAQT